MQKKDYSELLEKLKKTKTGENSNEIAELYTTIEKSKNKEELSTNLSLVDEDYRNKENNLISITRETKKELYDKYNEITLLTNQVDENKKNYNEAMKEVEKKSLLLEESETKIRNYKNSIGDLESQIEQLKKNKFNHEELNQKILELQNLEQDLMKSNQYLDEIKDEKLKLVEEMNKKEILFQNAQVELSNAEKEKQSLKDDLEKIQKEKLEVEKKLKESEENKKYIDSLLKEKEVLINEKKTELENEKNQKQQLNQEKKDLLVEIELIKRKLQQSNTTNLKVFFSPIDRIGTSTIAIKKALENSENKILIGITQKSKLGLKSYFSELLEIQESEMFNKSIKKGNLEIFSIHVGEEITNEETNNILLLINRFKNSELFIDLDSKTDKNLQEIILGISKAEKYLILQDNVYTIHKVLDSLSYVNRSIYSNWNIVFNKDSLRKQSYLEPIESKIGIDSIDYYPVINKKVLSQYKNEYKIIEILGQVDPKFKVREI